ncbi:DNA mismatch repair protein MutS [Pueribacillus theae]|uniref:DNA mismatch repair protein MutS n=1 Tax=Pueribacillus theae TaxID=2171751 RepID=A0A2U1K7Q3_9BACI|nr:DNA mismatch repair protein MutS [Pueribacillus theae]PWA13295.1 DNA mismatch repair protein MutS [Pueribacillus theae]
MAEYTPMIQQYLQIKAQYKDAFLFFRLGDFYELFFEDAVKAAKELEITLTKREGGSEQPIPMCGVPYHSAEVYIAQLIEKGYKIAICEQMEDPKQAKGVVRREVVQVITPGTVMSQSMIDEKQNNFISAITPCHDETYGLATSDLSTGENYVTSVSGGIDALIHEVSAMRIKEIILPTTLSNDDKNELVKRLNIAVSYEDEINISENFQPIIEGLREEKYLHTFGRLLNYLLRTQKRSLDHLQPVEIVKQNEYMKIDFFSKRNLELVTTIRKQGKKGSLAWLLDETVTSMGSRQLVRWIERPLIDRGQIEKRQEMVHSLVEHFFQREEIRQLLKGIYDLERLAGKISFGNVNARELVQLKKSLAQIPELIRLCHELDNHYMNELIAEIPPFEPLTAKLEKALQDDPPISIKEGGIIRDGYNDKLDEYRKISINGKDWLKELELKEKQETGIKSLKIGFNRVFGYYIEVTKANLHLLPEGRYERKQTLTNAERFITPELKEMEMKILQAEESLIDLEYDLFIQLREEIKGYIPDLQLLAKKVSEIDVLQSFAFVSNDNHYVRPMFNDEKVIIQNGRHPVVEKVLDDAHYVENDIYMDDEREILLITGPNMSGKSTYMRQLALTVIMAQIGCFVPAEEASLPIFDQVFTRIGAADDLISGQSTFMVEMLETKYAIEHATKDSLILLDEIGRGTSTYDGMALAHAIIEYIHNEIGAKTLFSTHYHELTVLENELSRLKNVHVKAVEEEGRVVFLHKVLDGSADESYGIHVAQLAELPDNLIKRAQTILKELEDKNHSHENIAATNQLSLFPLEEATEKRKEDNKIVDEVASLDLLSMTPIDAMNALYQLHEKAKRAKRKR